MSEKTKADSAPHVDLKKLYDKNEKYGVVVFRPMYFKTAKLASEFCSLGVISNGLNIDNKLIVGTNPGILNQEIAKCVGRSISERWNAPEKKLLDSLFTEKPPTFWGGLRSAVFKPEYFYGVVILPEGKYYFNGLVHYEANERFSKEFTNGENGPYFLVKAGYVNYIGDLCLTSLSFVKSLGFFSNKSEYKSSFEICDRYKDAHDFFKKSYPEVDLPFIKNLIKCCEPMMAKKNCNSGIKP